MKKSIILAGTLACVLVVTAAFINMRNENAIKNLHTPGTNKGFAVVELFTSEGCSSCPPADELIEKIQKDNKNEQIYIMAFHVDYWDHQGWKDRFSDAAFSKRQRQYADWLNLRTVYTPQIVINGTTEYVGSDRGPVLRAISASLEKEPAQTLTLSGKIERNRVHVEYQGAGDEKNAELVLAIVQKSAQSSVRAGENSGRSLSHVQIVREMSRFPIGKKEITMNLPANFKENGWELIGFVQDKSDGHITSADRFELQ